MKKTAKDVQTLKQVTRHVGAMIAKRLPAFDSLANVRNRFSELVVAAKSIAARDPAVADGLPADFVDGLDAAILAARSFRSGYASNDASQQIDNLGDIPGFSARNTVKSAAPAENGKRVSVDEFVQYAAAQVEALKSMDLPGQLSALRGLEAICRKANEEDFSDVLIPTSNDPGKQKADVVDGSVAAGATGTAAPSTASTNFSADGVPAAGAAAGSSNPATGSIAALAGGTGAASDSNFATSAGVPAAANAGATTGTGGVSSAASGAGETNTGGPNNFGSTDVTKAGGGEGGAAPAAPANPLETITKAADTAADDIDWSGDLTRDNFMKDGGRDISKSFGKDDAETLRWARGTRRDGLV